MKRIILSLCTCALPAACQKIDSKRNISLSRRLEESDIRHCTVSNALFKEVK